MQACREILYGKGRMWSSIPCPRCGSQRTARESGNWEWLWLIASVASFLLRGLLAFVRYGEYRGDPGMYRCANCGQAFTFFV